MAQQIHLPNAPIIEAIIDIQVKLPPDVDVLQLRKIHTLISKQYPEETERMRGSIKVKASRALEATTEDVTHYGYAYSSIEGKQILQVRLDGFTFSRLKPYVDWEQIKREAYRLWKLYYDIAKPELITRLAVRYINRLEIPLTSNRFTDFIEAPLNMPKSLPQAFSSFLTRIVVPIPNTNVSVIITQALEPLKPESKNYTIILDIDVFEPFKEGVEDRLSAEKIWEILDGFRLFKNQFFFGSITEEMVKLCV